jgi:2,4-dienoyl-CoA reductase-like NADH-dependent reductase (Old Yellow Enzyme family)
MHLAPRGDAHSIGDPDPASIFEYVASEMGKRRIAFIAAREFVGPDSLAPRLKAAFGGVFAANEKFTQEDGEATIREGRADAILYGKLYIANPDLPRRFATGAALNPPRPETFYTHTPEGYNDYPVMAEVAVS